MSQNKRYISKIRMQNFQNHTDTTVELHPLWNIIVGTSDAGKSSILRAINFVMYNRPSGESFIQRGKERVSVKLWFSDGSEIERIKGSENSVIYMYPDGTGDKLSGFGATLPEEVVEFLGNPPKDSFHGPIAYANQSAPLFLISLTPLKLPRCVSELIGIDDLEAAAKNLNSEHNTANKTSKEAQKRVVHYEQEMSQYVDIDSMDSVLAGQESELESLKTQHTFLESASEMLKTYEAILERGLKHKNEKEAAEQIALCGDDIDVCNQGLEAQIKLVTDAEALEQAISNADAMLKPASLISASDDDMKAIQAEFTSLEDAIKIINTLNPIEASIAQAQGDLDAAKRIYALHGMYEEAEKDGLQVLAQADFIRSAEEMKARYDAAEEALSKANAAFDKADSFNKNLLQSLINQKLVCPECLRPYGEDAC